MKARRVLGICVLAFLTLLSYELSRSSVESLFLDSWGADWLPWVWTAVAFVTVGTVAVYDHYAARTKPTRLFVGALVVSAAVLVVLAVTRLFSPRAGTFLLYVWKDVHVVVLLEILWTFANIVFPLKTARWVYGLFCGMGSLGGITGGLLVGEVAERMSTEAAIWTPLPVFAVLLVAALVLGRGMELEKTPTASRPGLGEALAVLRRSRYLLLMLGLVALVQVVITLVDYQYNVALEATFDTDERTAVGGRVYAAINVGAIVLQLSTGPILRALGVPAVLLAVPALLGSAVLALAAAPRFAVTAVTKVASKVFDYSIFKAAKEMLYIPLTYEEKTRGKAVIDMLTYRVAKVGASILIGSILIVGLGASVVWLILALVVAWATVTFVTIRRYRTLVSRAEELRGDTATAD